MVLGFLKSVDKLRYFKCYKNGLLSEYLPKLITFKVQFTNGSTSGVSVSGLK